MSTLKKKALFALLSLCFLAPAINFNSVFDFNVFQNMLASALSLIILISLILFKVEINLFVLNKSFIIYFFIFLLSLIISSLLNNGLILLGKDLSFYFNKPGALDAASGYFFFGQKSSIPLTDIELLKLYRGLS